MNASTTLSKSTLLNYTAGLLDHISHTSEFDFNLPFDLFFFSHNM